MCKIALLFAIVFLSSVTMVSAKLPLQSQPVVSEKLKKNFIGAPVYIQIFKEEKTLELYVKTDDEFRLLGSYRICNFSGGLGPKRRQGDYKSPEGFYIISSGQLKPDSQFYRAINIGFPNAYDRQQGYDGKDLMIHGDCVSVGCYAMTDNSIDEIYNYVSAALQNGQTEINLSIYPFRMTKSNMQRHRHSYYASFWKQLQPGYAWFTEHRQPPKIHIGEGRYVLNTTPSLDTRSTAGSYIALSSLKSRHFSPVTRGLFTY